MVGRGGAGVCGLAPCRATNHPAGRWVAGQGESLGADAAQVALPPLRLSRRGDSLQGLTGGGCNATHFPAGQRTLSNSVQFLRPAERLPQRFVGRRSRLPRFPPSFTPVSPRFQSGTDSPNRSIGPAAGPPSPNSLT